MSKNVYVIVTAKTGKVITENVRLPIFWYKREAINRAKYFIGAKVIPVNQKELLSLINPTTNERRL